MLAASIAAWSEATFGDFVFLYLYPGCVVGLAVSAILHRVAPFAMESLGQAGRWSSRGRVHDWDCESEE